MRPMRLVFVPVLFFVLQCSAMADGPPSPAEIYGPLFEAVEMQRVFPDSKSFTDMLPKEAPDEIVALYKNESKQPGFALHDFVLRHFYRDKRGLSPASSLKVASAAIPNVNGPGQVYERRAGASVCRHIDALWDVLRREPDDPGIEGSLLPLHYPYVVPGGRFGEIYYWDSYFTMQGLLASGRADLAQNLLRNLADLALRYGHVPNGNRSYYLGRSQPPFLAAMVELLVRIKGKNLYRDYLPALEREYAYWMSGADGLQPGMRSRRVVAMDDGSLLNRYWDDKNLPRDESYFEDVMTARHAKRAPEAVYRDLRAGAESGWDFSSRWLKDPADLSSIRTTDVVPIDLNSLLYQLEYTLATAYNYTHDNAKAAAFRTLAETRKNAINNYLWDKKRAYFVDYLLDEGRQSQQLSAATVYPLYFNLATRQQALQVAEAVKRDLIKPYGMATTTVSTQQQWDSPVAWAPLQWLAAGGLEHYGQAALAREIAENWSRGAIDYYRKTGKLIEKYNAFEAGTILGRGEYKTQDGFGWTNGVLRAFLAQYPAITGDEPDCRNMSAPQPVSIP